MANVKKDLIKRLNQILIQIVKVDDKELDKIGVELLDIEKKLMGWVPEKKHTNGN